MRSTLVLLAVLALFVHSASGQTSSIEVSPKQNTSVPPTIATEADKDVWSF